MGTPSGCQLLVWALLALLSLQKAETQGSTEPSLASTEAAANSRRADTAQRVTFIPPVATYPTMSTSNAAHNGRVCSTWGDSHYKTFDGDVFRFPGRCNYVFSAHCGAAYEDFNIQLRRGLAGSRPTITHIVLKSQGLVLEVSNGSVLIDGRREELPYSRAGLLVEQSSDYTKVNVRLMLTFMWNGEDSALLELDPKYANQTCGLCGDFNGLRAVNEFYAHNARLTPLQFGNLQKLDGPTEQCQDPPPAPADNCTDRDGICHRTLLGAAFAQCSRLVDAGAYVAACVQDLCRCPSCPCATFAEYSRQCAHAGGQPQNWRGPDFCPRTCPLNLQHQECGSPCADTCSNPERSQLCEDHCVDGCFCPPGTVLDDITNTGCLPLPQCPCAHGGRAYAPGASFSTPCSSCTCSGGLWQCQDLPCPGTCSVQGGSHISTYDEKLYDLHGDCSYVLSKRCVDNGLTVLAELRKCGLTDSENCLKAVTLSMGGGATTVRIQANGGVLINSIYTQLPVSAANITMFRPSTFFILVQTGLGLQLEVQLVPLMQVVLRLDPAHRGQMCGLCGNFNQNQADDLRALSGVVEGTAAAFANTWKTQAACPNVKNIFEDPCSLSVENENYAQHWCSLLTSPAGAFSPCHSVVNPAPFHSNCLFDTCNCERSEECLCAALSSYARACAAQGVLLRGWRDGVCAKYMSSCPESQVYTYVVDRCQPTCRALSQADVTCAVPFVPVDGCTCPNGTFLNDAGTCVSAEACPCYFRGSVVAPGEVLHDNGMVCSCARGKLNCLGATEQTSSGCVAPMVYLDCSNASVGTPGAECLRSCHTLDVDCFSTHCMSGCVCPPGLVSDGSGGCVAEEDCPCLHNEAAYRPGDTIRVDCNTCTCKSRRWECSHLPCLGTCVAYGDGHFITFDGEWYSFDGSCEYTLAQDHCGGNGSTNGTFRIVTENVPCGTTGVTCSKAIKLFLENYELTLHEGTYKAVQRGPGGGLPYRVRYMGTHLAIEARSGLVVSWDRKTSVLIRLQQDYKGRVCGLCGNFDDNAANDFTTRSQSVVGDVLEFGNSWKFSPSCPDAPAPRDPCTANPYRKSWAQKQCSIINGPTFAACRSQVDPAKYYEACVSDACACDSGGDCECFCTAVAAYAQACRDVGVCVSWRTPDVCPLFCDYYNPQGECEWHYQPCGAPCLRTCRNPSGSCLMDMPGLEGCYPRCPPSKPFFSEDQMKCVAQCGCHDQDGKYYEVGASVPTTENCRSCDCTPSGIQCTHSPAACKCTYEGKTYGYGDVVYNTTDGLGACLVAVCGDNGTIARWTMDCPGALSTTPFTFTSTAALPSTTRDVVYNKTDSAGCHFYAICTPHCELDRFQGACPTSTPPGPPSAVPPTSAARGCDLADPPRQVNETWTLENCTVAKCEGDNHIALLPPTPVSKVTCVNGREPIKVQSPQDPCESHYECECSCSGWGGSKYRTFDGTNYSFRGNCTHVLVREIQPRFGNLSVLLNSYYCAAAAAPASCPRALVIRYGPTEVTLSTSTDASGREQSLILFDHVRVRSGFSSNGVSVSVTANGTMLVDIPAIGASVTMRGQAFHILLSYSRFGYNTEGQCGTCTNNRTDDCRQPDGTMAPTCQDMAHSWLVPEGCWAPTGPPPTASSLPPAPTTSSASTCPPAPLCKLMLSQVFAECHSLVPPDPFFQTCVSDSCQAGPAVPCQTLEAYAALCRARGACRDWRSATGGLCDLTCPPGKVYEPCGPVHPVTCDSRNHSSENEALAEGCFCPDGHVLFNSYTDVCVPTCPCVGPDGFPKFPGERWVSNCQACECDEGSVAVQCTPVKCEAHRPPPECSQAGFVSVSRPQADNPCCSETLCVCNATTCPQGPPECGPGAELTRTLEEGGCCPTFTCRPKLCTYNGTVYGVGATFPATVPCHTCTCLSVDTQDPTVQCKEEACNTACPQGSEYVRAAGQCCGECVPTACLTPDGRLVQPNETWVDSRVDNCTEYRCQDESGVHMLVPRPVTCRDVSSCRGILRKTGCCYTCEEVDSCQVRVNRTVLRHGDCEALVNVTFCEGSCPGVSKYSAEAQAMQRQCTCCRETSTHQQAVTMQCPGGTAVQRTYTHVDACGCAPSCAPSPAAPEHSTPVLPSYGAIV
uniref:Mucin 5B, oligomeric mucus/gel-forming n=1 Tax=Rousettus aegyptiacus TaxID=9407 RepID=A0A7J8H372_ROUAE|nr:mucin 5B, oligomeric mucus/gel-forming [Rousettus aegyptiacus]